jgi:YVTN family beta-propeller protein
MAAYIRFLTLFLCVLLAAVMGVAVQEKVEERRDAQQLAVMAYVANSKDNTISVIDTVTHQVTAIISVKLTVFDGSTNSVVVTPNGAQVYVLYWGDYSNGESGNGTVSVINTATNQVTATISVGRNPSCIAITPNGAQVYVVNFLSNDVTIINTVINKVTATISVGAAPLAVWFVTVPTSIEAKTSAINKMTN